MERIVSACVLSIIILLGVVAPPTNCFDTAVDATIKENANQPSSLWFGPRLGRKKRNLRSGGDYNRNSDVEREQLAALIDILQDSPWTVFAVNEGKRHTVNFTPRLGRDSGEEYLNNPTADRWLQESDNSGEVLSQRSPPFAPRLGRHMSPYSPRLGRETEKNPIS